MAKKKIVKRPGRDSDQFIVRFPDGMRSALAELAARNGRSMNAEVVLALADHFANEGRSQGNEGRYPLRGPGRDLTKNELILREMQKAIERLTDEIAELRKSKQ